MSVVCFVLGLTHSDKTDAALVVRMPRRSVVVRNGTPRDALVNASLGLLPKGVKRAREELGWNGGGSTSSTPTPVASWTPVEDTSWIFVPVASAIGPKIVETNPCVKPAQALKVVDLISSHSCSSSSSDSRRSTEHVDTSALVTAARRHRPNGPLLPEQKLMKGSLTHALKIVQSQEQMDKAVEVFNGAVYAPQTLATKASLKNTWFTVSRELGFEPLPLSCEKMTKVAAVLRASGFRSTYSYLCEVRQLHVRAGFMWTNELELCVKDIKRAAMRGLGPPTKAEEIPEDMLKEIWTHGCHVEGQAHWPSMRHEVWIVAIAFLLRETELAGLRMGQGETHVDLKKKTVTLFLPVSKSDPCGKGCKRTLACTCGRTRSFQCPFCATLALVRNQVSRTGLEPTDPRAAEVPLVAALDSPWDTIKKDAVIEAIKADVERVLEERVEWQERVKVERVTGHTFRRTGAKSLARKGTPIELIQFMARHSSNAILGYVEEAIEESPNGAHRLQEHLELRELVNMALKDCKDLKESIDVVTEKLKNDTHGTSIQLDKDYVLQTFDRWARPEVVLNVVTGKLHSTAGNSFRSSPKEWATACGWKWITAGREAKACLESNDLHADFTICAKCRDRIPK